MGRGDEDPKSTGMQGDEIHPPVVESKGISVMPSVEEESDDNYAQKSDSNDTVSSNGSKRIRSVSEHKGEEDLVATVKTEERPRYVRSMSNDPQRMPINSIVNRRNINDSQDTIDKYYERNHHTITGQNQNTFNRIPVYLQRRMQQYRETSDKADTVSRVSSPGAMGETVKPTERKFGESLYWFALHRKHLGLRHICLLLLILAYTFFGALVFYEVEGRNERKTVHERHENLENLLDKIADEMTETINNPNISVVPATIKAYIKEAYIQLQKQESQYKYSTYYKLENPDHHMKWTFSSAIFFCMNVYTTTGYGAISCETVLGQTLTIIFGFMFVPITLVTLRHFGQFFLVHLTKMYAHFIIFLRKLRKKKDVHEDEMINIPIEICLLILTAYLMFCTTFIYVFDAIVGSSWADGIDYFQAFYFSFISLSTIGLGDIMPNNITFNPIISTIFFLGMAITKVVNRSTYLAVENGVFGMLTIIENKLDTIVASRKSNEEPIDKGTTMPDAVSLKDEANEYLNNFTVRSIANFMRSNADVYGGGFGKVHLRRGDLLNNDTTVSSADFRPRAPSIPSAVPT